MVFEADEEREALVAELRRLRVTGPLPTWIDDAAAGEPVVACAVAWWDEVLPPATARGDVPRDPAFDLAAGAYLENWSEEVERVDLFAAAAALAGAAQAHRAARRRIRR